MSIKDALEVFVNMFHGDGAQCVKEASDFHSIIGVRVAPIRGGHQQTVIALADLMEFRRVGMAITQHEAHFGGHFAQQVRSWLIVSDSGWGKHSGKRKPDCRHNRNDVQFPARHESTANPMRVQ
jgi:hypothetical protein